MLQYGLAAVLGRMRLPSVQGSLLDQNNALYERIQNGALEPDDLISAAEVRYDQHLDRALEEIYRSRRAHKKSFKSFIPTFDIFRTFSSDQVVLDVGAHWGYSAVTIRHSGCAARIVSIEAMPVNMPPLRHLASLDPKYSCINAAASDSESVLRFYTPVLNGTAVTGLSSTGGTLTSYFAAHLAGLTSAYPARDGRPDEVWVLVTEVASRRIDDILRERGESDLVVAVKMDIEGHEPSALRGAERLFSAQRPLLMIEGANRNPDVAELMDCHGYFHAVRAKGYLVPHPGPTDMNDGFRVHPDKSDGYRAAGILRGPDPPGV